MVDRRRWIIGYPITGSFSLFVGLFIILIAVFTFQLLHAEQRGLQGVLIDDAYISLRYSHNLIEGHGIVWQPGDRVEGYTNFLWVLLSSLLMLVGVDGPYAVRYLGVFSSIISLALLLVLSRHFQKLQNHHAFPIGIAAILVGINYDFAYWTLSGLESPLFIMLSLAALYFTLKAVQTPDSLRYAVGSGLSLAAATLTRPDGVVFFIALGVPWLIYRVLASRRLTAIFERPFLVFFALYSGIVLTHLLWRYSYYGQLLPNTFYVKVGSTIAQVHRGANHVLEMTRHIGLLPLIALAPFALLLLGRDLQPERLKIWTSRIMVLSMVIGYTAYLIVVGGDVFVTRLFTMIFVLLCLMIDIGVNNLIHLRMLHAYPIARAIPLSILALALFVGPTPLWRAHIVDTYHGQISWIRLGGWLRAHAEPNDTLAVDAAGAIPYFSNMRSIDMLGLNDAHIAHISVKSMGAGLPGHEKFDPAYVYAHSPTWIATWLDREGRASSMGMYRWPDVLNYRLEMILQIRDFSRPWMEKVEPGYDPHSGFARGYHYGLWKRIMGRPTLAYTTLDLDDETAVQRIGPWEWLVGSEGGNDYLSSITPSAALQFEIDGGQAIAAVTLRHTMSGQIRIQANGQSVLCDLYNAPIAPQVPCILPPVGRPGERIQATVVVGDERHPASKGTGVHIQRLLVLPPATYAQLEQLGGVAHPGTEGLRGDLEGQTAPPRKP